MTTIVLFGKGNKKITQEIYRMLSIYGVTMIGKSDVIANSKNPRFQLIEYDSKAKVKLEDGIVVFIGNILKNSKLQIEGNFKGIVFSSDKSALQLMKKANITAITCGMAEEDTLILSSIKEDSVFVCLNRKITTLNGNIIEPQEHKINIHSPVTDYALLATAAILLSSDLDPNDIIF